MFKTWLVGGLPALLLSGEKKERWMSFGRKAWLIQAVVVATAAAVVIATVVATDKK